MFVRTLWLMGAFALGCDSTEDGTPDPTPASEPDRSQWGSEGEKQHVRPTRYSGELLVLDAPPAY